jgi:hypothetical protein
MSKYLVIDDTVYPVKIVELSRSTDALDLYAYRTEDGILHRKCIGTYDNYQVSVGIEDDIELYDALYEVLASPVNSHMIKFPNESSAQERYVSSVQDKISRILENGTLYKGLSFKCTCVAPTRRG